MQPYHKFLYIQYEKYIDTVHRHSTTSGPEHAACVSDHLLGTEARVRTTWEQGKAGRTIWAQAVQTGYVGVHFRKLANW